MLLKHFFVCSINLTGAVSWYMLTFITEAFGVRGELGNLVIEPKLMQEQFDQHGKAQIELVFANKRIKVVVSNSKRLAYGEYAVKNITYGNGKEVKCGNSKVVLKREIVERMSDTLQTIAVELDRK